MAGFLAVSSTNTFVQDIRGHKIDSECSGSSCQLGKTLFFHLFFHIFHMVTRPTSFAIFSAYLSHLVPWHNLQFHNSFRIRSPSSTERSFDSALAFALETREGTAEEVVF